MAIHHNVICPHCKKDLPPSLLLASFDKDLNLACYHCNKIVFGITKATEDEVKKAYYTGHGTFRKEPLPIRLTGQDVVVEEGSCFE